MRTINIASNRINLKCASVCISSIIISHNSLCSTTGYNTDVYKIIRAIPFQDLCSGIDGCAFIVYLLVGFLYVIRVVLSFWIQNKQYVALSMKKALTSECAKWIYNLRWYIKVSHIHINLYYFPLKHLNTYKM